VLQRLGPPYRFKNHANIMYPTPNALNSPLLAAPSSLASFLRYASWFLPSPIGRSTAGCWPFQAPVPLTTTRSISARSMWRSTCTSFASVSPPVTFGFSAFPLRRSSPTSSPRGCRRVFSPSFAPVSTSVQDRVERLRGGGVLECCLRLSSGLPSSTATMSARSTSPPIPCSISARSTCRSTCTLSASVSPPVMFGFLASPPRCSSLTSSPIR
jgi:hypothetical protein